MNQKQRNRIVKEAQDWADAGTPYRGHACLKGTGTDCGQFIFAVFRDAGLVSPKIEAELPKDYSLQVAQHRASTEYISIVDRFFRDIPEAQVLPGDVVVYKLGHAFSHAGVVVSWPEHIIHAELRHGVSGAHGTKTPAFLRAPRVFRTLRDEFCEVK